MFLWRKPLGRRTFRMTQEAADSTAVLAGNQGLYNGFLAAGLLWGLSGYGNVNGRAILKSAPYPPAPTGRSGHRDRVFGVRSGKDG